MKYRVIVNGKSHEVEVTNRAGSSVTFSLAGETHTVTVENGTTWSSNNAPTPMSSSSNHAQTQTNETNNDPNSIVAPMPGTLTSVAVKVGDKIQPGTVIVVLEAMKMENPISAKRSCEVVEVLVKQGDEIRKGQVLVRVT